MYDVIEIAKYIVTICAKAENPVSNLKLQKILYFLWIDFFKETERALFLNEICAWQLGPVVPKAYYEFCPYGGSKILKEYDIAISQEISPIIDKIVKRLAAIPASDLVDLTHQKSTPWYIVYKNGQGNRHPIPFELICSIEC